LVAVYNYAHDESLWQLAVLALRLLPWVYPDGALTALALQRYRFSWQKKPLKGICCCGDDVRDRMV